MSGEISPLAASLNVALGGAVGSVLRYHAGRLLGGFAGANNDFPWGTLTVNILGSLAMGVLVGWLARGSLDGNTEPLRLLIGVGLLGGFTTFSAFSAEMVAMLHRGQPGLAAGYAAASLIAGMAAMILGLLAAQSVT